MAEDQVADAPESGQAPSENVVEFNFRDHLEDDLKTNPALASYKDINGMAKSLVNAQKMVGADKIAIPGSWANESDWANVYTKLGRPDSTDGYEIDPGEGAVDENVKRFKEMAFNAGLNNRQAQMLLTEYNSMVSDWTTKTAEETQQSQVKTETALRKDWGDAYERNMQQANEVVDQFGEKELIDLDLGNGTKIGDNEQLIRLFAKIGAFMHEKMGEDSFSGRDSEPGMSNTDIQTTIARMTAPGTAYWDKMNPQHDNDVQEVLRLRSLLHG
tara:strand:+ start:936 stop:1751 length:816 start_codon:yes stop_codon:yes gene_type:complete